MWNKSKISALLCVLLLALVGCRHSKEAAGGEAAAFATPQFSTLSVKSTVTFSQGERQLFSVGAQIRMRRDSAISISFQPFPGVEVARLFFSATEAMVVDRMNKRYFKASYDEWGDSLAVGVDLHSLQSVLLAVPFVYGRVTDPSEADFNIAVMDSLRLLQCGDNKVLQEFVMEKSGMLRSGSMQGDGLSLRWTYSDFSGKVKNRPFPLKAEISMQDGPANTLRLRFDHKKADEVASANFNGECPSGYTRLTATQLKDILSQ